MPQWDENEQKFMPNVYIGDRTSSMGHLCIYNKKLEVRSGRLKSLAPEIFKAAGMTDNYWYRFEYRAKGNKGDRPGLAQPAFQALLADGSQAAFYFIADSLFDLLDNRYNSVNVTESQRNAVWKKFLSFLSESTKTAILYSTGESKP